MSGFKNIKKMDFNNKLSPEVKKILWGIIFIFIISLILTIDLIPGKLDLEIGQVSYTDIEAPGNLTFIDEERTEELRKLAAEDARKEYKEDSKANKAVLDRLGFFFERIKNSKEDILAAENEEIQEQLFIQEIDEVKRDFTEINEEVIISILKAPPEIIGVLE